MYRSIYTPYLNTHTQIGILNINSTIASKFGHKYVYVYNTILPQSECVLWGTQFAPNLFKKTFLFAIQQAAI